MNPFEPQYKYVTETYYKVYSSILGDSDKRYESLDAVDEYIDSVGGQFRVKKHRDVIRKLIEWEG